VALRQQQPVAAAFFIKRPPVFSSGLVSDQLLIVAGRLPVYPSAFPRNVKHVGTGSGPDISRLQ